MPGGEFERFFSMVDIRMAQFIGSSKEAERLGQALRREIKIEDSGYDWKLIGPNASESTRLLRLSVRSRSLEHTFPCGHVIARVSLKDSPNFLRISML